MLSPDELSVLPEVVSKLYSRLEKFTIAEIARRIMNTGKLTETALHQMRALQHSGQDLRDIENEIKRTLKISTEKLDTLYDDAILRAQEYDKDIYSKTDLLPALEDNYAEMLSFAEALKAQTQGELYNFTRSMGFAYKSGGAVKFKPIAGFYQDTLDFALLQVRSGVLTMNEAVKQAVDKMAESGIKVVDYESGAVRSVEAAVRTAVHTGLSQISGKVTEHTMHDFDTDLVEVTAHEGARDKGDDFRNHKSWQGKVYSLKGDRPDYPNLASVTGYGDVAGLKGANCRHDMHAFIEGVSVRAWTDEELANIDPPPFEYEGKTYTHYEATQKQNALERAIKKEKLKLAGYEAAGLDEEFTASSVKLKRLETYYKDFSEKAGIKTRPARVKAVGYDRSVAQKAVAANKNLIFIQNNAIIKKSSGLPKKVQLPDEKIKQTVNVSFGKMQGIVPKGATVTNVYTMAGKGTSTPIRDLKRLHTLYGGNLEKWEKKSADVYTDNYKYVIHWYENGSVAPKAEFKIKGLKKR